MPSFNSITLVGKGLEISSGKKAKASMNLRPSPPLKKIRWHSGHQGSKSKSESFSGNKTFSSWYLDFLGGLFVLFLRNPRNHLWNYQFRCCKSAKTCIHAILHLYLSTRKLVAFKQNQSLLLKLPQNPLNLEIEPVCCRKRQKIVPDLLVCEVVVSEGPEGFQTDSKWVQIIPMLI